MSCDDHPVYLSRYAAEIRMAWEPLDFCGIGIHGNHVKARRDELSEHGVRRLLPVTGYSNNRQALPTEELSYGCRDLLHDVFLWGA